MKNISAHVMLTVDVQRVSGNECRGHHNCRAAFFETESPQNGENTCRLKYRMGYR